MIRDIVRARPCQLRGFVLAAAALAVVMLNGNHGAQASIPAYGDIGREMAIPSHLRDDDELATPVHSEIKCLFFELSVSVFVHCFQEPLLIGRRF